MSPKEALSVGFAMEAKNLAYHQLYHSLIVAHLYSSQGRADEHGTHDDYVKFLSILNTGPIPSSLLPSNYRGAYRKPNPYRISESG